MECLDNFYCDFNSYSDLQLTVSITFKHTHTSHHQDHCAEVDSHHLSQWRTPPFLSHTHTHTVTTATFKLPHTTTPSHWLWLNDERRSYSDGRTGLKPLCVRRPALHLAVPCYASSHVISSCQGVVWICQRRYTESTTPSLYPDQHSHTPHTIHNPTYLRITHTVRVPHTPSSYSIHESRLSFTPTHIH